MKIRQRLVFFLMASILIMVAACGSTKSTSMEGFWMDNANNVTTIEKQNDQYVATLNYYMLSPSAQNTLVSSSYENGILTWKYCPPAKPCITMKTVSFNGDNLNVTWVNANGESGEMTLKRTEKGQNIWSQSQ